MLVFLDVILCFPETICVFWFHRRHLEVATISAREDTGFRVASCRTPLEMKRIAILFYDFGSF